MVCVFSTQNTKNLTTSIESILSGSPTKHLWPSGVLATSSFHCSRPKTAALCCYFILLTQTQTHFFCSALSRFLFFFAVRVAAGGKSFMVLLPWCKTILCLVLLSRLKHKCLNLMSELRVNTGSCSDQLMRL